tara:strand:+ start:552 stop:1082 length:531 start_codon:yes stop_codon:yes gene_type:complete
MEKQCFKCLTVKPITDFYTHKRMGDGHLNKCKDCTKRDSDIRGKELSKNPEWVDKEKKRAREKYYRLGYKELYKQTTEQKKATMARYKDKYPEKIGAARASAKLYPKANGNHMHHWSYNKEHWKDCIILTAVEHNKLHRYMVYDQEQMMYRRTDNNELLDTKERHINYFNSLTNKD